MRLLLDTSAYSSFMRKDIKKSLRLCKWQTRSPSIPSS